MTDALRPAADFLSRRSVPAPQAPTVRPRRLRTTPAMRRLAREHVVDPSALILPVFVREDIDDPRPVEAMPGVVQHTLDSLRREAAACAEADIVVVDIGGPLPSGYHSDCTRTYAMGEPSEEILEQYALLERAQRARSRSGQTSRMSSAVAARASLGPFSPGMAESTCWNFG